MAQEVHWAGPVAPEGPLRSPTVHQTSFILRPVGLGESLLLAALAASATLDSLDRTFLAALEMLASAVDVLVVPPMAQAAPAGLPQPVQFPFLYILGSSRRTGARVVGAET